MRSVTLPRPSNLANDRHLMAALVVFAGLTAIVWAQTGGELIAARDGLGYDGSVYAGVVRNPSGWILDGQISAHRVQRVLPSLIVHGGLRPFDLQGSNPAIIVGFQVLNYSLMAVGAYVWSSISERLGLSRPATWFGFFALFANYALFKFAGYYPILTDTAGWFLGLCLLWSYMYRRHTAMLAVALAAAFTWPTVFYSGLLLFTFSRSSADLSPKPNRTGVYAAVGLSLAVPAASLIALRCGTDCVASVMVRATERSLLPLSVALLVGWVFLATRPLCRRLDLRQLWRSLDVSHLFVSVALLVGVAWVQSQFSTPTELTLVRTLQNISLGGIARPGGFLVAHSIYFGPAVLLAAFWWHRTAPIVAEYGPALVLLMIGYVLLAVDLESRKFMNIWPFVVTFLAVAVDRAGWEWRRVGWFGLLCVVTSRFWLPLNWGELTGDYRAYPDQYYFMSMGPRMTLLSYMIMLAVTVLMGLAILWIQRQPPRVGAPASHGEATTPESRPAISIRASGRRP